MYLSKAFLLKAFSELSLLDGGNQLQGLTVKTSVVRYFLALDALFKRMGISKFQVKHNAEKKTFYEEVAGVVGLYDGAYTHNFIGVKVDDGTCCTSSNFIGGGPVLKSKSSNAVFDYPSNLGQGKEVFRVQNETVSFHPDAYNNISSYLHSVSIRCALITWLARSNDWIGDEKTIYDDIVAKLTVHYSSSLCSAVIPAKAEYATWKASFDGVCVQAEKPIFEESDFKAQASVSQTVVGDMDACYQQITYGAPGTGKSWGVEKEIRDAHCEGTIRTTFHPDSDYSTFVGTYKPAMRDYGADEKTEVYRIVKASGGEVKTLEGERVQKGRRVAYEFVPQAFLEAYVAAWRKCAAFLSAPDDASRRAAIQFLVIEEINRGDCAKIFGDLFQLLDREDDGYSTYAVKPDTDIRLYLNEAFAGNAAKGIAPIDLSGVNFGGRDVTAAAIASGEKMLLPPNMYIRATMNTSDQSLFPMDSAFKRRWDWKYVPICNHAEKAWTIAVDSSLKYEWWDFLEKINKQVFMLTNSEDKQLGYFFVKAKGDEVSLDMFVNKVVFYLWNVVFKDCFSECDFLKSKDGNDHLLFTGFFNDDGTPKKQAVVTFLDALKVKKFSASGDGQGAQQQSTGDGQASDNGGTAAAS